jgi:hypothetical protein
LKNVQFLKNIQILKIIRIIRKKNNEKRKGNEKPEENNKIIKKQKKKKHAKKTHPAELTGQPSIAPTRAKLSFAPLTGGPLDFPRKGLPMLHKLLDSSEKRASRNILVSFWFIPVQGKKICYLFFSSEYGEHRNYCNGRYDHSLRFPYDKTVGRS